ncbi:uncharacterized protein FFNC_15584 [Fusarium fujikuroi]|nr:uncharacterized protein FFNC_15584 [Fusarium fujikuroi]
MARPKTGSNTPRQTRSSTAATNAGVPKVPAGRVVSKVKKTGDRVKGQDSTAGESQPDEPSNEDFDMNDAPPIDEPSESVSDSPAESSSSSTESTPAQFNSSSTESTAASDHGPTGDDLDEVVCLTEGPSVDHITRQMNRLKIKRRHRPHRKDEVRLAIVTVSAGHKWEILGFGPPKLRRFEIWSWKSKSELKRYAMTEDEKELEVHTKEWKGSYLDNDRMRSLGGVAMVEEDDISLLIPVDGKRWPPSNIRILVNWEKHGEENVFTASWEPMWIVRKAWGPRDTPYLEPGKAKLVSTRKDGSIFKNDKAVLIQRDISVGEGVLEKGRRITRLQYAVIDTAVRCQQRYHQGSKSKDKDDIAKRFATPGLTENEFGDSTTVKSGETRFIAPGEALDKGIKEEK